MEKVKLSFDWSKFDRLNTKASELAQYANSVAIPLLKAMEIPITREDVLSTCRHPEHPCYVLEQEITGSKFEKAAQREQLEKAYKVAAAPFAGDLRRQSITGEYLDFCHLNGDKMEVDEPGIEEAATVWLTKPKELKARAEHEELCKRITTFVKQSGINPAQWRFLFSVNLETGEISPNSNINPYSNIAKYL